MMTAPFMLSEINALDREGFVAALGELYEGPPWIVEAASDARPFASLHQLHAALDDVMWQAARERQVGLLRAHPDLVGEAAQRGTLTASSSHEQAAAGLGRLSEDEVVAFNRLNAAYRERFGFPFVICARENKKNSILAGFAARMGHTEDEEIATALREVSKISWLRLCDTVRLDHEKPIVAAV
jgi:OHCU decarboxylase